MKRKTYEEVLEAFKERGYKLITKEYRNNKQRLEYICPEHTEELQSTRLNDLLSGHGCRMCGMEKSIKNMRKQANSQRLEYKDVKREIAVEGFILLSTEYKSARHKLEIQCPEGHVFETRISDFRASVRKCRECAIKSTRTPFEEVKKEFENKGYELIDTEYKNQTTPLKYICPKHPEKVKEITMDSIKRGHGCFECGIEKISGERSVHYNHALTSEEREKDRRKDLEERKWRIAVFQRDEYTCQKCGAYSRNNINAHHKDGYHWCIERRYDISNGETLCVECHKEFHVEYGYKNNTEKQFDEWVNREGE